LDARSQAAYDQTRLDQAKLLLDSIGCACAAIEAKVIVRFSNMSARWGQAEATVIGFRQTSVFNAVRQWRPVRVLD
jgi:2-methylcitrate dehydratase PrpD